MCDEEDEEDLLRIVAEFDQEAELGGQVAAFCEDALQRAKKVDCFEFVPSNHRVLQHCLTTLKQATADSGSASPAATGMRFCEWGSGIGIGVGIATMLGFRASGIEINQPLVDAAEQLFEDYGLKAHFHCGSYYDIHVPADWYFTYAWASTINQLEAHFDATADAESQLLICYGADRIQQKSRRPPRP